MGFDSPNSSGLPPPPLSSRNGLRRPEPSLLDAAPSELPPTNSNHTPVGPFEIVGQKGRDGGVMLTDGSIVYSATFDKPPEANPKTANEALQHPGMPQNGRDGRDDGVISVDTSGEPTEGTAPTSFSGDLQPVDSGHTPPVQAAFPYAAIGNALRATLGSTILGQPGPGAGGGFDGSAFDSATFDSAPTPPSAPRVAPLEGQVHISTRARVSVEASVKTAKARPRARTKVGRSVLKNAAEIELIGASFIALIDSRIEELQQKRPNSDEAKAAVGIEIAGCEDLKRRVQAFLGAAAQFSTEKAEEKVVVNATTSVAEGIGTWWSKKHVQICDQTFQLGLFGVGVAICSLAGAGGVLSVAIPGVISGGKPVADVIKAYLRQNRDS
jgi:hypothetical protein